MSDLIERDALLLKQKAHADLFADSTVHDDIVRFDESTAALAEIINAPSVNRWIPVEDALPETDTPVICYMRSGQILVMVLSDDDGWYCGVTRYYPLSVTHWAYLPEPPEKE